MKSINKALDILEVFLHVKEDKIPLSELARFTGLNKATVNRIAVLLAKRGYLHQSAKRGKYSLGQQFTDFSLAMKQTRYYADTAMPYLMKLSRLFRECIILSVFDGGNAVVAETIEAKYPLRVTIARGNELPLYCTGQGKAILANLTENELERYLKKTKLRALTRNTITDVNTLKHHLKMIVREGVAYDDEEELVNIRNVAAPIKNADGKVCASVGVLGPSVRLTLEKMQKMAPEVKRCASAISKDLGYRVMIQPFLKIN